MCDKKFAFDTHYTNNLPGQREGSGRVTYTFINYNSMFNVFG